MSNFFKYFPTVKYDPTNTGNGKFAVNILKRFHVRSDVFSAGAIFYNYEMQEGDRPDIIAQKYYGDSNLAWLVMYFNNILNPLHDFPLTQMAFENYIIAKYGSSEIAKSTVHHYEKIISPDSYTSEGIFIPERSVNIDEVTYLATDPDIRKVVYVYDYEETANNNKRFIRLLDKSYAPQILAELSTVFADGQ